MTSLGYGLTSASWCIAACWAMMLMPLVGRSAHLWLMAAVFPIALRERYARPPTVRPRLGLVSFGLAAMVAGIVAAIALRPE
jgi:predicted metal-binding membrane protein